MPEITLQTIAHQGGSLRLNAVFLHGLGGDAKTTWRHGTGFFWPEELAKEMDGLAVYLAGYPADKASWNCGWPVAQAAVAVLDRLMSNRTLRASKTPIVFLDRIAGVVFLATPHSGSFMATIADKFHWFASDSMSDLRANYANLNDLSVTYRNTVADINARTDINPHIRHCVYYETVGIVGMNVVEAMSADPGVTGVRPIAIARNHIEICKPPDRYDQVYEGVLAFLDPHQLDYAKPTPLSPVMNFNFSNVNIFVQVIPSYSTAKIGDPKALQEGISILPGATEESETAILHDLKANNFGAAFQKLRLVAECQHPGNRNAQKNYLLSRASQYTDQGELKGDKVALRFAITILRELPKDEIDGK